MLIHGSSNSASTNGTRSADAALPSARAGEEEDYNDERAQDVITGRLVHGHLVDDDYPSPTISASISASVGALQLERLPGSGSGEDSVPDVMTSSIVSGSSFFVATAENATSGIAAADSEEEDEAEGPQPPVLEKTITLVGNVKGKTVFIVDDMIDKPKTWVAAAETVVKRGGAKKVYCIATHGLFGWGCLQDMERCECIDYVLAPHVIVGQRLTSAQIVVTNSFPIPTAKARQAKKLVVIDLSNLLAEAIRRNHYGERTSIVHGGLLMSFQGRVSRDSCRRLTTRSIRRKDTMICLFVWPFTLTRLSMRRCRRAGSCAHYRLALDVITMRT